MQRLLLYPAPDPDAYHHASLFSIFFLFHPAQFKYPHASAEKEKNEINRCNVYVCCTGLLVHTSIYKVQRGVYKCRHHAHGRGYFLSLFFFFSIDVKIGKQICVQSFPVARKVKETTPGWRSVLIRYSNWVQTLSLRIQASP